MKERIIYLDIIRIVACCMIVLMHSPHPNAGNAGFIIVPLTFITESGVGLFFMISGALLLPIKSSPLVFMKKRVSKVVPPVLFWTFFYLFLRVLKKERSLLDALMAIPSIPFSAQGHGVFWFIYVLIGIYLLSPLLSAFLIQATKKDLQFYLILWLVTLCYPLLKGFVVIDDTSTGVLYYFTGYVGYYVLGYYLKSFDIKIGIIPSLLFQ